MDSLLAKAQEPMQKALSFLQDELRSIRSGRATPSLIDTLEVEVYGQKMQLKQLASISASDAKSLTISPWDQTNVEPIEKAIRENQQLGLNPVSDGKALHINIPPLTAEVRERLVKQVGDKVEACYIRLRNIRHDILNEAKKSEKDSQLSEDEYHGLDKQLSKQIDELRAQVESLAETKRGELREI